jgi:hypothetical protein
MYRQFSLILLCHSISTGSFQTGSKSCLVCFLVAGVACLLSRYGSGQVGIIGPYGVGVGTALLHPWAVFVWPSASILIGLFVALMLGKPIGGPVRFAARFLLCLLGLYGAAALCGALVGGAGAYNGAPHKIQRRLRR